MGLIPLLPVLCTLGAYALINQQHSWINLLDLNLGSKGSEPSTQALTATSSVVFLPGSELEVVSVRSFRQAVNTAMSAAKLTQFAKTPEEWHLVASQWEGAIASLQAIPPGNPRWSLARRKMNEYQQNLAYARQNVQGRNKGRSLFRSRSSQLASAKPRLNPVSFPTNISSRQGRHQTGNWLRVATTPTQEAIYIDPESVVRDLPYVEFWQRTISSPEKEKTLIHDQQWIANCQTHQLKARTNHRAVSPGQRSNSLGSVQANLLTAICGRDHNRS